jgi:hypothetical protein
LETVTHGDEDDGPARPTDVTQQWVASLANRGSRPVTFLQRPMTISFFFFFFFFFFSVFGCRLILCTYCDLAYTSVTDLEL